MTARSRTRLVVVASLAATLTLVSAPSAAGLPPLPEDPEIAPPPPLPDQQGVSIGNSWAYESDGTIDFQLTLDAPADHGDNVVIGFTHLDTTGADFVHGGFNYSFVDDQTEATLEVDLVQLDGIEAPEAFQMYLTDPEGLEIEDGVGAGTIFDGNGPTIDLHDAETRPEGDPGEDTHLDFEVQLSYAAPEDIQVRFASTAVPGEAEPDLDYESVDEIMTVPAGADTAIFPVAVVEDLVPEASLEAVSVWIADASAGTIQDDTAAGRIEDDDLSVLSVDDVTEVEGTGGLTDFRFTVSLDQPAPYDIDVDASVVAGTAGTPADWQDPGSTTITFAAGETTMELVVAVVGDATVEPDEDFTVVLDNEQMAELGDGVGLGTILDDDAVGDDGGDEVAGTGIGRDGLPFTGASTLLLTSGGALLLGAGLLLLLWRRRHEAMA